MITCCIFDLDGVLVDTAHLHFRAWAELACDLGFDFSPQQGEATKGISRMASLDIVLSAGGLADRFSLEQKEQMAATKNARYLWFVAQMTRADILPGVERFLLEVKGRGVQVVLGSASKNAGVILDRCALRGLFDVVVDGTLVSRAKPHPEVFSLGATLAGVRPTECVVFEDAAAGIEAARAAGMRSVGVGEGPALCEATMRITSFEDFTFDKLVKTID